MRQVLRPLRGSRDDDSLSGIRLTDRARRDFGFEPGNQNYQVLDTARWRSFPAASRGTCRQPRSRQRSESQ